MNPDAMRELAAAAARLLDAMDPYETGVDALGHAWDPIMYSESSDRFESLRLYATAIPALSTAWIDVLITRFEFADALWQTRMHPGSIRVLELIRAHKAALARLRERARLLVA